MAKEAKRVCSKCGLNRLVKQFPPDKRRADGLSLVCRPCRRTKTKAYNRQAHLMNTYGISLAEYDKVLAAQGGRCAICGGKRKVLDVDHDHKTGVVRGLLCRKCNKYLLPAARDSITVLSEAINYLETPPAVQTLGVRICPS